MSDEARAGTEGTGTDPRDVATQDAKILAVEYFKTLRDEMTSRDVTRWTIEAGKLTAVGILLGVAFAHGVGADEPGGWLFLLIPFLALIFDMVAYERLVGILFMGRYIREELEEKVFSEAMHKSKLSFTPWETYMTRFRGPGTWDKLFHRLPHVVSTLLIAIVCAVAVSSGANEASRGHAILPLLAPVLSFALFELFWSRRFPNAEAAALVAPATKASPRNRATTRTTTRAATATTTGARSRSKTKPSTPPSA